MGAGKQLVDVSRNPDDELRESKGAGFHPPGNGSATEGMDAVGAVDSRLGELSRGLECASRIFKAKREISKRQLGALIAKERKIAALENRLAQTEGALNNISRTLFRVEPISAGRRPSTLDTRISVIIPVRNGGETIRELLGKIRSQKKVRDVEIMVIDS